MRKLIDDWGFILLACLTIGLAPYVPEPHIWGKLRWVAGGAKGMQTMDWFDLLMHGLPWALLLRKIVLAVGIWAGWRAKGERR